MTTNLPNFHIPYPKASLWACTPLYLLCVCVCVCILSESFVDSSSKRKDITYPTQITFDRY